MGILRMESILKPEWKVIYEQTELDNDNFQTFESDKARNSRNPFLNYNLWWETDIIWCCARSGLMKID